MAGEKALLPGPESPAIAHNELVASARFVTFDGPQRDFPGNRSPPRWEFVCRPKRKICAPGEGARFQRRRRRSPLLSKATALLALVAEADAERAGGADEGALIRTARALGICLGDEN